MAQHISGKLYPIGGLSVLIEAVDQNGLISRKSTRIEREKSTRQSLGLPRLIP